MDDLTTSKVFKATPVAPPSAPLPSRPDLLEVQEYIRQVAAELRLDPFLCVKQCETESAFNSIAVNKHSGAVGLFQIMPATGAWLGFNIHDWKENVQCGLHYMEMLINKYALYTKAYAAYNWGPGNLNKCIRTWGSDWRDHLPAETSDYLKKILGA